MLSRRPRPSAAAQDRHRRPQRQPKAATGPIYRNRARAVASHGPHPLFQPQGRSASVDSGLGGQAKPRHTKCSVSAPSWSTAGSLSILYIRRPSKPSSRGYPSSHSREGRPLHNRHSGESRNPDGRWASLDCVASDPRVAPLRELCKASGGGNPSALSRHSDMA